MKNVMPLDLVLERQDAGEKDKADALPAENRELRRGDICPKCKQERLDYDGLLNLSCAHCGYALGGCFT